MNFISYSQNFEDVVLWRALKDVRGGFYLDIGAQDPIKDSISFAFYQNGWRGVHLEPSSQYSEKLKLARPDEIVIQKAVGTAKAPIQFYEFEDTGLSTGDAQIAEAHHAAGYKSQNTLAEVISLDSLFNELGVQNIHWMKIDVEGWEEDVLKSWVHSSIRPWVVVIESTAPMTEVATHEQWESLILAKGYAFSFFDGLNRFYVHNNHAGLTGILSKPANVFDRFVTAGLAEIESKLHATTGELDSVKAEQDILKGKEADLDALTRKFIALSEVSFKAQSQHLLISDKVNALEIQLAKLSLDAASAASMQEKALQDTHRQLTESKTSLDILNGQKNELERLIHDEKVEHANTEFERNQLRIRLIEEIGNVQLALSERDGWYERVVSLHSSTSWQVTKPLRAIRRLCAQTSGSNIKYVKESPMPVEQTLTQRSLRWAQRILAKFPYLSVRVKNLVMKNPRTYSYIIRSIRAAPIIKHVEYIENSDIPAPKLQLVLSDSGPRIDRIYKQLVLATSRPKNG